MLCIYTKLTDGDALGRDAEVMKVNHRSVLVTLSHFSRAPHSPQTLPVPTTLPRERKYCCTVASALKVAEYNIVILYT